MWWQRSATCSRRPRPRRRNSSAGFGTHRAFVQRATCNVKRTADESPEHVTRCTLHEPQGFDVITGSLPRWLVPGRLMRVTGWSMAHTLRPGDLVWVGTFRSSPPTLGELVAARPLRFGGRALVKRIAGVPHQQVHVAGASWRLGADQFFLLGDCPERSEDSRAFGPVGHGELIGPVRCRIWPSLSKFGDALLSTVEA